MACKIRQIEDNFKGSSISSWKLGKNLICAFRTRLHNGWGETKEVLPIYVAVEKRRKEKRKLRDLSLFRLQMLTGCLCYQFHCLWKCLDRKTCYSLDQKYEHHGCRVSESWQDQGMMDDKHGLRKGTSLLFGKAVPGIRRTWSPLKFLCCRDISKPQQYWASKSWCDPVK